jgi:hypothetical protein
LISEVSSYFISIRGKEGPDESRIHQSEFRGRDKNFGILRGIIQENPCLIATRALLPFLPLVISLFLKSILDILCLFFFNYFPLDLIFKYFSEIKF